MNLITKEYQVYKFQVKVQRILFGIIILSLLYIGYVAMTYTVNKIQLDNYTNLEAKITSKETEIKRVEERILLLEEDIKNLDKLLASENISEEAKQAFFPNSILYNVLVGTNNGTKLHSITVVQKTMEVSGASLNIEDVASLVEKLSEYYEVGVNKIQQVNHETQGVYYAFKIVLTEKGV